MPKILTLMAVLGLALCFFTACSAKEEPYQQYLQAYQRLQQESSFELQNSGTQTITEYILGAAQESQTFFRMVYQLSREQDGLKCIANINVKAAGEDTVWVRQYFREGYLYSQNMNYAAENYRSRQDEELMLGVVMEGIIDFPAGAIERQSAEETEAGLLLTFELNREKYAQYRYANDQVYVRAPLYTVLLDQEGRIRQVDGHFQMGDSKSGAETWRTAYTIVFLQFGGVEPEFPDLEDAVFPEQLL